jgi:hypothetical protein
MKTVQKFTLLAAFLFCSLSLLAQTQEPMFFIVETMKSTPNKSADYEKNEREIWKKLHQERIKRGLIVSWNLYAVRYPSGSSTAYDYVTVTVIQGMKKVENPWGTMFADAEKLLTKDEYTKAMAIGDLRNLTTSTVYYGNDFVAADPKATTPSKYQMINMMKIKDDKWDEAMNMETKLVKPMHVEMMKSGGKAAWGLYTQMLPSGENQVSDYVTSDFFNTWDDMNKEGDFKKALAKVHPGMSAAAYDKKISDARRLVNRELWELIDFAR